MNARNKRLRFGLLVGTALAASLGCGEQEDTGHTCTLIGCGAAISFELEATHWAPGEYVISIETSGLGFECRFTGGMAGSGGQARGPAEEPGMVHRCDQLSGDPANSVVELTAAEDVSIDFFDVNYEQLSIRVQRDDALLLDEEVTPVYQTSYPNGPDCGACSTSEPTSFTLPAAAE